MDNTMRRVYSGLQLVILLRDTVILLYFYVCDGHIRDPCQLCSEIIEIHHN